MKKMIGITTEANMMEGPTEKVTMEKMVIAIRAISPEKAARLSDICVDEISATGEAGIHERKELC